MGQRQTVEVRLSERTYPIEVGVGASQTIGSDLAQRLKGRQLLLATDSNLVSLYADTVRSRLEDAGFKVTLGVIPAGEASKTLCHASQLWDVLVEMKADRNAVVVALGGGVVGDLAGFVAATYARGIPFVQVPTSLLAMVDASVGGKVAVDHPYAKNMIGCFHQPTAVFCDLEFLNSLSLREYRCGLAEVVKHGVILDAELFGFIEGNLDAIRARQPDVVRHLVVRSCQIKGHVVENDERETTGLRAMLNYGHTFAHAFETATGYGRILHGEAVAMGMVCASRLAERLGRIDAELTERQIAVLEQLGLPVTLPDDLDRSQLIEIMRRDKKARAGLLRFILPSALGRVELVDEVNESLVQDVLNAC